jgi:hypothetical protein
MENGLTLAVALLEEIEELLEIVSSELSLDSSTRQQIETLLPDIRGRISSLRGVADLSCGAGLPDRRKALGKGRHEKNLLTSTD